jgi:general secretion pathway protein A
MQWPPLDRDRVAVNSRRRALDRLWTVFQGGPSGPVLITGEPGAGKSWVVRRFCEGLPTGWGSAEVELTSSLDSLELLHLVGAQLGLEMPERLGAARLRLGARLRDDAVDGRRWLMIVDEVQRGTAESWEEMQALSNQLGQRGGFAAMILQGRTELAREVSTQRRQGWTNRLSLHIHLPPLDLDEARALLRVDGRITELELEAIHRDTLGNPRAMLRIAAAWGRSSRPAVAETPDSGPAAASPLRRPRPVGSFRPEEDGATDNAGIRTIRDAPPAPRLPSLIPARPPIRLEDGLVEVGWEGDLETEFTRPESATSQPESAKPAGAEHDEELVEDRYAALQAWAEWSRNRERVAPQPLNPTVEGLAPVDRGPHQAESTADSGPEAGASVRAEPAHDFAPYNQLFSRLRHSF